MKYTYPLWQNFFAKFGTTPEAVFGPYTPENCDSLVHGDVCYRVHPQRCDHLDFEREAFGRRTRLRTSRRWSWACSPFAECSRTLLGRRVLKYFPVMHDVCCSDSDFKSDGTVSAVYVAHGRNQRDVCARHLVLSLLQLHRNQRERHWSAISSIWLARSGGLRLTDFSD